MKTARVYIRVSTDEQDTTRQKHLIEDAKAQGFYIAGVYEEKASGARPDRPELLRMIADIQPGDVVIAEKIDRLSRLPVDEAETLIKTIKAKGAKLAIPGIVDFSELVAESDGVAKIVLEATQDMLLKLALQMARDDYETRRHRQRAGIEAAKFKGKYKGRQPNIKLHDQIIQRRVELRWSIGETAYDLQCSTALIKRVCQEYKKAHPDVVFGKGQE